MKIASTIPVLLLGVSAWMPPAAQAQGEVKTVKASFYSSRYNGHRTAAKERFSNNALTAAHRQLPFGTKVRLTNPANNKSVVVRINDRGPFVQNRDISITRRAARELGIVKAGVADLSMVVVEAGAK